MDDPRLFEAPPADASAAYQVVARRYRPQSFAELVGQQHVAQALAGAIASGRIGHAYLFTGARGVGKTSAARILAKSLNCVEGLTAAPCNRCDICQSISTGDDVDVVEIDGASNRQIDDIRELRQNVNVRPSRARFKIYIIDEVHMLTREAFNALLKTLEEPPDHVKFVFCTTDPEKIPITILSRCQRFDFAGIQSPQIVARLRQIVQSEGIEAEDEALELLARRAAGSMRDSQSLLEQLLAFGQSPLRAADVHQLLGTAGEERLAAIVSAVRDRDAAQALAALDTALGEGVEVGQLLDQLLGYFRDVMVAAAGAGPQAYLYASPAEREQVAAVAQGLGLETILAVMQILEQAAARLKYSAHGRIIAELALVRVCRLENLEELAALLAQARSGAPMTLAAPTASARPAAMPAPAAAPRSASPAGEAIKKNGHTAVADGAPSADSGAASAAAAPLSTESVEQVWQAVLGQLPSLAATHAAKADEVTLNAAGQLVATFPATYNASKLFCERPEQASRLEAALKQVTGRTVKLNFAVREPVAGAQAAMGAAAAPPVSRRQRLQEVARQPLVQRAMELFDAQPVDIEEPGA